MSPKRSDKGKGPDRRPPDDQYPHARANNPNEQSPHPQLPFLQFPIQESPQPQSPHPQSPHPESHDEQSPHPHSPASRGRKRRGRGKHRHTCCLHHHRCPRSRQEEKKEEEENDEEEEILDLTDEDLQHESFHPPEEETRVVRSKRGRRPRLHRYLRLRCRRCGEVLVTQYPKSALKKKARRRLSDLFLCYVCHWEEGKRYCSACNNYLLADSFDDCVQCRQCVQKQLLNGRRKTPVDRVDGRSSSSTLSSVPSSGEGRSVGRSGSGSSMCSGNCCRECRNHSDTTSGFGGNRSTDPLPEIMIPEPGVLNWGLNTAVVPNFTIVVEIEENPEEDNEENSEENIEENEDEEIEESEEEIEGTEQELEEMSAPYDPSPSTLAPPREIDTSTPPSEHTSPAPTPVQVIRRPDNTPPAEQYLDDVFQITFGTDAKGVEKGLEEREMEEEERDADEDG